MLGISKELAEDLEARGYTEADVARLFGPKAHAGELRVIYQRSENGDRTSPLPSSRHAYYYGAKNWVAVAIADDPQPAEQLVTVPADIQEHGKHDRVAVWTRKGGRDAMNSSCRNAAALLSKGWQYQGLADEDRLRAVAEARPYPPAPPAKSPTSAQTVKGVTPKSNSNGPGSDR